MKSLLMILAFGALSSAQAQTSQWVALGVDSDDPALTFSIDYGRITTPAPGLRRLWITVTYATPVEQRHAHPAFEYDELRNRVTVRCASKEMRTDETVYLLNGTSQRRTPSSPSDAFQSIAPGGFHEQEAQIACGRTYGARSSSQGHSSRWIILGGDSTETVSIDSATISTPAPGLRILWTKETHVAPVEERDLHPAFKYDELRIRSTVRCAPIELRTDEMVYLLDGAPQRVLPPNPGSDFRRAAPQTYGEAEAQLACGGR